MVNTSQQVGGSIGTALLSTLAASAGDFTVAFWWAAGLYVVGALVSVMLLRADTRPAMGHGEPAAA